MSRRGAALFLHAAEVAAVAGVNLYEVALVDEQRHAYLDACLERGGLGGVGGRVALDAGLAVGHAQVGLHGHLGVEYGTVGSVGDNLDHVALFHVLAAYYKVVGDGYLFEGLLVHEYAAGGILVEILVGAALYAHVLKLEAYLEGAVEHTAVGDVLQLGAHHGVAFAGLYVLEVDAYPHLVVQAYAGAFLNFL